MSQASESLASDGVGAFHAPVRRNTLSSDIAARFSDTIGWSPKGFPQDLLANSASEAPIAELPQVSNLVQPASQTGQHHDSNAEQWKATLERAVKGIVSIKYTSMRSFDLNAAGSYIGTGFVVDRTKGIILSNRHIITPGPTTSTALFSKYEELPLAPLYFDPVHDFGFYKYDPAKIKYAEIEEIELCPDAAKVGMEVKVCGNNAGEQGSILGSTLSRLDRPAPYQTDFNTFYIQAASGTTAGSSGSPVLDILGRAVALNVGGSTSSASSFYLPLEQVVRALKLLQDGKPVPRGTLQTEFIHSSYDELKKLGLPDEIEREARQRNECSNGLLTVSSVLPEGPGSALQTGDIVVKCCHPAVGNRYVENFNSLWEIIDQSIDQVITLTVIRGKEEKEVEVKVQNLNLIIPDSFLEVGQAVFHHISYQIARLFHMPCRGLFVASSGMFPIPLHSLITHLDGRNVNTLEDLMDILQSLPDDKRVALRYRTLGGWSEQFAIFVVDHHFSSMVFYKRLNGLWERKVLKPRAVMEPGIKILDIGPELTWKARLKSCLLTICCRTPYNLQGVTSRVANGIGILVSADPIPLVVVSRTLVPSSICDIWITVGNHTLPGRVVYLGIVAVVTLNGTRLQGTNILPICTNDFKVGERLDLFAIDKTLQLVQLQTEIREIAPTTCGPFFPPRWRLKNVESLCVLGVSSDDGFLLDPEDKSVVALWMSIEGIKVGLHYDRYVRPIIEALQNAREIENRCCGWSFGWMALSDAVQLGLSDQRASQIAALVRAIRSVPRPILITGKLRPGALDNLRIGDIILEVNGRPVVRMADIHILSQTGSAQILVLRNRQELNVNINTQHLPSEILSRIISWAGVLLHETHDSVLEQITPEFEEIAKREGIENISRSVYISSAFPGSPASLSLFSGNWISEVDGHKVMTMDDMVHVISTLQTDREYVRVKMIGPNGVMNVRSVKPDPKFWPAWFLEWKDNEWVRTELE